MQRKSAIVLAMFGTTAEKALSGLLNIYSQVCDSFPATVVKPAFTSNIIRSVWQRRAADPSYRESHPEIPDEIFNIRGPLAAIADLQDQGYTAIVVQAVHMAPAEEFHDLNAYVKALASIKTMKQRWMPFQSLVVGRPILGSYSQNFPYANDILLAAQALEEDADLAEKEGAALVYMGHGNPLFPSGGMYTEFGTRMRELYPAVKTFIATVEGYPSLDDILPELNREGVQKILLKPFLIVAGEHARNDMAGEHPSSWKNRLEHEGYEVVPILRGLGEQTRFSSLFIRHITDAADFAGIRLE